MEEMITRVLATTHEVSLKGGNRRWFESTLTGNVNKALAGLPVARIERPAWRVLVHFSEPIPFEEAARRLGTVFGLHSIQPVQPGGRTVPELLAAIDPYLGDLEASSFAIRCIRSDKSFPRTSVEIEREVGTFVQERTGWQVNLSAPGLVVRILLDQGGFHFWVRAVKGPGGLPTGTGGRATCLLSGGIDSPVAAYLMMKRGMRLDYVHFHSVPRTDPASLEKVEDLARVLVRYQGPCRVAMVPLLPIQEQIVSLCPTALRVLLYRRFMLRLSQKMSAKLRGRALVTGESLGQVASQTIENLAAVESVVTKPVLRPLIGLDKQEIIAMARRIGTYELSITPHFDCCSFLVPEHPATRSTAAELADAEQALNVPELVTQAAREVEILRITNPVDWDQIPAPPGSGG